MRYLAPPQCLGQASAGSVCVPCLDNRNPTSICRRAPEKPNKQCRPASPRWIGDWIESAVLVPRIGVLRCRCSCLFDMFKHIALVCQASVGGDRSNYDASSVKRVQLLEQRHTSHRSSRNRSVLLVILSHRCFVFKTGRAQRRAEGPRYSESCMWLREVLSSCAHENTEISNSLGCKDTEHLGDTEERKKKIQVPSTSGVTSTLCIYGTSIPPQLC